MSSYYIRCAAHQIAGIKKPTLGGLIKVNLFVVAPLIIIKVGTRQVGPCQVGHC